MASIALGIFILGIIYVVVWSVINDDAGSIRGQKGLIRMRAVPGDDTEESSTSRPRTRRSTRSSRLAGASGRASVRRSAPESAAASAAVESEDATRLP